MSKRLIGFGLALAMVLSVVACEKSADATKSTGRALNDAAKATGEALENAADYVGDKMDPAGDYKNRKVVAEASRETIKDLRTKWMDLRNRTVTASGATEDEFGKVSERMDRALDGADAKLVLAEEAHADAWHDARSALDEAVEEAQEIYGDALDEFGD